MSGVYLGSWPPPESAEHAGTGSADEDWPPREPDDTAEPDPDAGTWYAPALKPNVNRAEPVELGPEWQEVPKAERPHRPDGPMAEFQQLVDRLSDDKLRAWRATGLDLMPSRWRGHPPDWWLEARAGS